MPIFVCERTFAKPLSEEDFAAGGKVLGPCIEAREVKWLASNFAADGTRSVCIFEAADAERVREANRTANMPFDKVWQTRVYKP
jgi:hypothetical protein